jgi:cell division protein FtsA
MKNRIITGIDVGTTKIATIVADVSDAGPMRVVGVGIVPSTGLHKGMVVNINEAKESIRESIKRAEQASNYKIESAYIGITGRHVTSLNNRGVVAITRNDRLVRGDDLRRVMSSAQSISVPNDRRVLHVIPRNYAVDGQVGVKNPVGMHGFRLDVETHVITAAVTSVQNLVKCVRGVGLDIDELVLEPLASSEAVLSADEKDAGVILADIGGGTTDIAVFKDGSIYHTSVIPVAGYQFTRDIAIGLGLPFDVAEEMKKRYGSVMPVYESKEQQAQATAISQDGHGVSYQDLCDIVRARIEELLKLILLELPTADYRKTVSAGLVLTGGSSNLPGIDALGRELLQMPVRVGAPSNIYGISDILCDPAYATGVGLVLWGARHQGARPGQNWESGGFGSAVRHMMGRFFRLFR